MCLNIAKSLVDFVPKALSTVNDIRLLAKLGDDSFSLVLFGTKVADSKEFYKKSIKHKQPIGQNIIIKEKI